MSEVSKLSTDGSKCLKTKHLINSYSEKFLFPVLIRFKLKNLHFSIFIKIVINFFFEIIEVKE
jgi:hypothetical protein